MDEYLYIIVGIAALIFNVYQKANKKKKQQEAMAQAAREGLPEEAEYQHEAPKENFPTDVMGEFDKIFGNTRQEPKKEEYDPEELMVEAEPIPEPEKYSEVIVEKPKQSYLATTTKSKTRKINLKQAIIYKTILERKY